MNMYSKFLNEFYFWGWQVIIFVVVIILFFGLMSFYEYVELEWLIDFVIVVVWVVFGVNMFGIILKCWENYLYVVIWFYIVIWVIVMVFYIGNNLEILVSMWKSYLVFVGVQDVLIQWWYGYNVVVFFLIMFYLGFMYYFLFKVVNCLVYFYQLLIIYFWVLIFIYIWVGFYYLLYMFLFDWVQLLGMVFFIMLIVLFWGGMFNGLLILWGVWDCVCQDFILKFMVVVVIVYGMVIFEGLMFFIKFVNVISYFIDWIVGYVYIGILGWNGFLIFGVFYWLILRIF